MATLYGTVEAWLRHPKAQPGDEPVLVTHPDTLARCLAEGWTVVERAAAPIAPKAPADDGLPAEDAQTVRIAAQRAPGASRAKPVKPTAKPTAKPVKGASHGRA